MMDSMFSLEGAVYLVLRREFRHQVMECCGEQRHDEEMAVAVLFAGPRLAALRAASVAAAHDDLAEDAGRLSEFYSGEREDASCVEVEVLRVPLGQSVELPVGSHAVAYQLD